MRGNLNKIKFINQKLLGRKRSIVEIGTNQVENVVDMADGSLVVEPQYSTETIEQRREVIKDCQKLYNQFEDVEATLNVKMHKLYCDYSFTNTLPSRLTALDASQPWLLYWVGNSLKVMDETWFTEDYKRRIGEKIFAVMPDGGPFPGGLGQEPHLMTGYSTIGALCLCENYNDFWGRINTKAIYDWLMTLKTPDGGFKTTQPVGEVETRSMYTALSVASLLGIMTDELTNDCVEFLVKCQTYEGGFGGSPQEDEAHGGYTYCAVASLAILGALDKINIPKLMEWCSTRQYNEEKGFSGRSNKLVDGCYSFWIGGSAAILDAYGYGNCFDKKGLENYILKCCQQENRPGLKDKPGANPDFYHTNYCLLGLSVAQYDFKSTGGDPSEIECTPIGKPMVNAINPIYGIPVKDVRKFKSYFKK
ncbi:protein farnesyltransferase Ecym_5611 [Eremothecium cymbalariae DBVPG|uniref:Protein farnesyltransferase subunit beta n=1 Tax=Eremothecium cymbalariae (strain CBS 270.75 / DBVPG 7215 / KCTC 17166 / NRRL Y-17582) TaxID=931890 RepID=I6NE55_ERECY|nr:hypothetical protein Ecym_5611 [Eremothecium cymbalariae DBVPG\